MAAAEVNFDGLVGLSHNYGGLSYGNVASASNRGSVSNPRAGALEGIDKMLAVRTLGLVQGVLPPQDRPHLATLRALGYGGDDADILAHVAADNPALLSNVSAASAMWTANAATVSPKWDSADGRTHFTAANLTAMFHRAIEAPTTARLLRTIFADDSRFAHHPPLAGGHHMGDEGAANHNRFCADYGTPGVALFVYGRDAFGGGGDLSFPGRQTREASAAIARQHGLAADKVLLWRQNPAAINAGAFHNDVVAVSNRDVFFYHEDAFAEPDALESALQAKAGDLALRFVRVPRTAVPLVDAVKSYLFNSQLVSAPGSDRMTLILPSEVAETPSTKAYVDGLITDPASPIGKALFMDVRQSMRNGGGPACLRLRVVLDAADQAALGARVLLDDTLADELKSWVLDHYRDQLSRDDLSDPAFWDETMTALDRLTQILRLGSVYDFQLAGG